VGESIVAAGLGAAGHRLDGELVAGATLALLVTIGLWSEGSSCSPSARRTPSATSPAR
jgi:hypothetical protein